MTIWKDIPSYEGIYQVSNDGNVRSLDRYVKGRYGPRLVKGRVLSPRGDGKGYLIVALCRDGKIADRKVHRLVAQAFIPHEETLNEVNHLDGDKANNRAENLEWCTRQENISHAMANGLRDDLRHAKKVIRSDGAVFPSMRRAAIETGVNSGDVSRVASGRKEQAGGYGFQLVV